jgi:cell division protein FtsZ
LCALVRDRHSESVFACVEAIGAGRSREVVEKLLTHPLLDEGRALAESDSVLVSLLGGKDLTMAEVNRVMEQISRQSERAQIIMGAAVDAAMKDKLSVTVIAAKKSVEKNAAPVSTADLPEQSMSRSACGLPSSPGFSHRAGGNAALQLHQREQTIARHGHTRKSGSRMRQEQLPLAIVAKGRFDKSEPTIHKGEDLDIPTYIRRGVPLN